MQTFLIGQDRAGIPYASPTGPVQRMRGSYRVIAILATALMLVGGFALMPSASSAQETAETRQTVAPLHMRAAPALDTTILLTLPLGAQVDILTGPVNGYYHVEFERQVGWAHEDFLAEAGTADAAPALPAVDGADVYSGDELVQVIYAAADTYGQPREDMLRVAQCESTLDPGAYNASSGASGLFQFLPSTWATTPYAGQDVFDPVANANAAAWMWSEGRRGEWSCQ